MRNSPVSQSGGRRTASQSAYKLAQNKKNATAFFAMANIVAATKAKPQTVEFLAAAATAAEMDALIEASHVEALGIEADNAAFDLQEGRIWTYGPEGVTLRISAEAQERSHRAEYDADMFGCNIDDWMNGFILDDTVLRLS